MRRTFRQLQCFILSLLCLTSLANAQPLQSIEQLRAQSLDAHYYVLPLKQGLRLIRLEVLIDDQTLESQRQQRWTKLLKNADANSDDILQAEEFTSLLTDPILQAAGPELVTLLNQYQASNSSKDASVAEVQNALLLLEQQNGQILPRAETDQDTLPWTLFDLALPNLQLTSDDFGQIWEKWARYDRNQDETLTLLELQTVLETAQSNPDSALPEILIRLPQQRSGISESSRLSELRAWRDQYGEILAQEFTRRELYYSTSEFSQFDADDNGTLNSEEMLSLFSNPIPHLSLRLSIPFESGRNPKIDLTERPRGRMRMSQERPNDLTIDTGEIELTLRIPPRFVTGEDIVSLFLTRFRMTDTDANDYLDANEFAGLQLPINFETVDSNNDEMITTDEVAELIRQLQQYSTRSLFNRISTDGTDLFQILDSNEDARLSQREVKQAFTRLSSLDRDQDASLTPTELQSRLRMNFEAEIESPILREFFTIVQNAQNQQAVQLPPRGRRVRAPIWFVSMDVNRDGDLSQREFWGGAELFQQLDTDQDLLISVGEAEVYDKSFPSE